MTVLAIENSSAHGSIAVVKDGEIAEELSFSNPRGRGSDLFPALSGIVKSLPDIDLVVIGKGPGSYNGLRSASAAGWGIARARGIPAKGVCSLLGYDAPDYTVVGDARAGQWFVARISGGALASGPELVPSGTVEVPDHPLFTTSPIEGLESATVAAPSARILARHFHSAGDATPVYLKPPHITTPTPR